MLHKILFPESETVDFRRFRLRFTWTLTLSSRTWGIGTVEQIWTRSSSASVKQRCHSVTTSTSRFVAPHEVTKQRVQIGSPSTVNNVYKHKYKSKTSKKKMETLPKWKVSQLVACETREYKTLHVQQLQKGKHPNLKEGNKIIWQLNYQQQKLLYWRKQQRGELVSKLIDSQSHDSLLETIWHLNIW